VYSIYSNILKAVLHPILAAGHPRRPCFRGRYLRGHSLRGSFVVAIVRSRDRSFLRLRPLRFVRSRGRCLCGHSFSRSLPSRPFPSRFFRCRDCSFLRLRPLRFVRSRGRGLCGSFVFAVVACAVIRFRGRYLRGRGLCGSFVFAIVRSFSRSFALAVVAFAIRGRSFLRSLPSRSWPLWFVCFRNCSFSCRGLYGSFVFAFIRSCGRGLCGSFVFAVVACAVIRFRGRYLCGRGLCGSFVLAVVRFRGRCLRGYSFSRSLPLRSWPLRFVFVVVTFAVMAIVVRGHCLQFRQ
jgi:hypothetical protein